MLQVVPSKCSESGGAIAATPEPLPGLPTVVPPTAMQSVRVRHPTEWRSFEIIHVCPVMPEGGDGAALGLGTTDHAEPSKCSIRVEVVVSGTWAVIPTARQNDAERHEMPSSTPDTAGVGTGVHERPSKCSMSGRWPGTIPSDSGTPRPRADWYDEPTAKQSLALTHEIDPREAPLTPAMGRVDTMDQLCLAGVPEMLVERADAGMTQLVAAPKASTMIVAIRRQVRRRNDHRRVEGDTLPFRAVPDAFCINPSCPRARFRPTSPYVPYGATLSIQVGR